MKSLVLVLTLLLVLVSGCSLFDLDGSSGGATATMVLKLQEGEQKPLPPFDASLHFVEKTDDSRCPVDVVCASAGEATALLTFAPAGEAPRSFTLTWPWAEGQGSDDGHPFRDLGGFRFTLLDLLPYPDTRVPDPGPAVITLRVQKLP